jgi:asparagine N-glycosylation enzyme membrane subunit Stt3
MKEQNTNKTPPSTQAESTHSKTQLTHYLKIIAHIFGMIIIFYISVNISLGAVIKYGRIMHEFDPWFNYRVTEH